MWEFAIKIKKENQEIASYIFDSAQAYAVGVNAVITTYEDDNFISVVLAVEDIYKEKMQQFISHAITRIVGSYFKGDYLEKHLNLHIQDIIGMTAFKKALINFDKETDYFIISKALSFERNLFLESFYDFRLGKLREKWSELIALANENKDYLLNSDAFLDLLKFLVDNIDISEDEIDVVEEGDGYRIFTGRESIIFNETLSKEGLISSIIDMSPQKINLYCKTKNNATDLIQKVFEKRVNFKFATEDNKSCITFKNNLVKV